MVSTRLETDQIEHASVGEKLMAIGLGLALVAVIAASSGIAQAQTISTIAGTGAAAYAGDGVFASQAPLNNPRGIAVDAQGNIYIADTLNHRIRRFSVGGVITTVAGNGTGGFAGDGGLAINASLNQPEDVWIDAAGNLYIADSSNHRVRRVSPSGIISTIAGIGSFGYNGDGIAATSAQLNRPTGVVVDASGNVFIADSSNHRIRRVSTGGIITTIAGNGVQAYSGEGVQGSNAALRFPIGLTIDASGNLFFADAGNHVVRRVTPAGIINTVAGNGTGAGTDRGSFSGEGGAAISAGLNTPEDVAVDSAGTLFIADTANYRVRRVSGGVITTIAGTGADGFSGDGGAAISATLNLPRAISLDAAGGLLIGDMFNQRIRIVSGAGNAAASPGNGPGPGPSPGPAINNGGVVEGASFRSSPTGGAIISIFGANLSEVTQNASTIPLPTNLGGTSVTINGAAAPLFFVSPTQINLQVPSNLAPGIAAVQVSRNGVNSPSQSVSIAAFSPAIFTVPSGGTGPGAILHNSTGVLVSSSAPAARGEFISIYCTGLGAVQPLIPAGTAGPSNPPANTVTTPTVTIGGITAIPTFSGLAPSFAGLYQVNVQVPQGVASGNAVQVSLTAGGVTSNVATLAVQ
jgi:uncharacterized protein (TIGR03437 family)